MEDFVECVHDMIDEIRDKLDDIELNYPKNSRVCKSYYK